MPRSRAITERGLRLRDELAERLRGYDDVFDQLDRLGFNPEPRRVRDQQLTALAAGKAVELPSWIVSDALWKIGASREIVRSVEGRTTVTVEPDGRVS